MIDQKFLQTPKGTRDYSGKDAEKRIDLIRFFQDQFRLFDFESLITPNIEYKQLIDSKDLNNYGSEKKLLYSFKDLGNRDLFLKYDQTVPLARYVASNPVLPLPYKRYAIERAYRYENVQKGRYREFWQCDLDIVGSDSIKADIYIIFIVLNITKKLGFNNAKIYFNDRRIINNILNYLKVDSKNNIPVIRELDKIDKIGLDKVQDNISNIIGKDLSKELISILNIKGTSEEKLESVKKYIPEEVYSSLESFFKFSKSYQISENIVFDLFLARGLDYYTSFVFELIDKTKDIGSLGGGGRYNNLVKELCGRSMPSTGFAFGFERIYSLLNQDNNVASFENKIYIVSPKDNSTSVIKVSKKLYDANISNFFDVNNKTLSKQLKYAVKNNYKYVLFCDLDEIEPNKYKLKNLEKKEETICSLDEIINIFKK